MGGIGVQRSLYLVQGLRDKGYEPVVLTVAEDDITRLGSKMDEGPLEQLVSEGIQIIRVPSGQPDGLINLFKRLRLYRVLWTMFYPWFWERYSFWPKSAQDKALELIDSLGIRLVYSSSAPYTAMELAFRLKKIRPELKWVNDIRDPWTEHFGWIWPSKLHWYIARGMEKRFLRESDHVVVVSREMQRFYTERGLVDETRVSKITNAH